MGNVAIFKGKLVKFLAKAGILIPKRTTTDRSATPEQGETAFNTTDNKLETWNGSGWAQAISTTDTGTVTSTMIADLTIVNGDVSNTAAIAGTKIDPNFGSQNISTTGNITTTGTLNVTGASSKLTVDVSSVGTAVEIRQLGVGNALVVLDDNSGLGGTDPSVTIIDASGNVGIGVAANASLTNKLEVLGNAQVTGAVKVVSGDVTLDSAKGIESHTAASTLNVGTGTNTQTLNLGTGSGTQTVNIGTGSGITTINIGGTGDSVVVAGTLTTVNTTNLDVKDKNITLNKGGTAGSANGSGISIEANSVVVGSLTYDQTDGSAQPQDAFTFSGTGAVAISSGTTVQRPNTASNGMVRYNSSNGTFEGYASNAWSTIGGKSIDIVTQNSHGFVVGDALYLNGATYTKAIATAANTAEVVGVVSRVVDINNFELTLSGEVTGLVGLTAGEVYFLSATSAGVLTITEPSTVGQISIPVAVASSTTSLYVDIKRGLVVGAANARTTITVINSGATSVVDVTNYNSLKLEGELNVNRSSGGNQRAYYTVEATKNGAGTWQVSAGYTGDDILYTNLPTWDVSGTQLQVTMPTVTNFNSASLTYSLNAPAVGASLPLSIDSSSLNIVDSAPLSYRNVIINGNFDIWQRGTSQTSNGYGSDDRWQNEHVGSTKTHSRQLFTIGQADVPGNPKYFSRTVVSSVAGAGNAVVKSQKIESVATFAGETATLSFWAKADSSKNMAVEFSQVFGSGGSPSAVITGIGVTTIALTTSWKKYTVTVNLPSIAGKTLGTNNDDLLQIFFWFDAGSSFNARTNSLGQQSGTFDIAQVQLEVGSKASAFERRPYGMELGLAMRYYEQNPSLDTAVWWSGNTTNASTYYVSEKFKVTKRIAPIITLVNSELSGFGAINVATTTIDGFRTQSAATITGSGLYFRSGWKADSEL